MEGWKEGERDDGGLLVVVGGESIWSGKLTWTLTFKAHTQEMV